MPTLISAADFRTRFDISDDIHDPRITPHIGSASRRLRKWVGEMNYAYAVAGAANADMTEDLKNAEAHLAFHYAISGFNTPLSTKGVVATATASEGNVVTRYLAPKETAELAQQYLELAREICEPYLLSDGTPASPFESVGIDEGAEASTRTYGGSSC